MKVTTRKYFDVAVSINLDERYCKKDFTHNVTISVYHGKKYYHHKTKLSLSRWEDVTPEEEQLIYEQFNHVFETVKSIYDPDTFSLQELEQRLKAPRAITINSLMRTRIASFKGKAKLSSVGHYRGALKIFDELFGEVPFAKLHGTQFIQMREYMEEHNYSPTTIAIYLNDFKSAVNEALHRKLIDPSRYPFKQHVYDEGKVEIPKSKTRADSFLDKDTMTRLWNIYRSKPNEFAGLFFFSYLAGGMNMADILRLKWDSYLDTNGELFRYKRSKTQNVTNIVIAFPVTEEIKFILRDYTPKRGEYVFPYLSQCKNEEEIQKRIQYINNRCSYHARRLCNKNGVRGDISATWARHSFNTVMRRELVPLDYIECTMGHVFENAQHYFGGYTPEQMREYHSHLLAS